MKNKLTLLFTIHSEFNSVNFFLELINQSKRNYEILFAFDCSESDVPAHAKEMLNKHNINYITPNKNIGKLALVIFAANQVNTDFFKIIDQDDSLYLEGLWDINQSLLNVDTTSLVKHKALKIYNKKRITNLNEQSVDSNIIKRQLKEGKDIHLAQQTNCDTIYPTKVVKKASAFNLTRQDFHNDVLLSNFVFGFNPRLSRIKNRFYIQFHGKGQTKSISNKRSECIVELYDNYLKIKLKDNSFNFRSLMWRMKISHISFIKAFTSWYLKNDKAKGKALYKQAKGLLRLLYKQH